MVVRYSGFKYLGGFGEGSAGFLVPVEMGGLLRPERFRVAEGMALDLVLGVGRHGAVFLGICELVSLSIVARRRTLEGINSGFYMAALHLRISDGIEYRYERTVSNDELRSSLIFNLQAMSDNLYF